MRNENGFTLVEVLTTIVVIGLLLLIAVPTITNILEKSRADAFSKQESFFSEAGESYFVEKRLLDPESITWLVDADSLLEYSTVSLNELIQTGNITEIIDPKSKNACDINNSYVQITKYTEKKFGYIPYLICDNYESAYLYTEWSEWSETEIVATDTRQVQVATFYNYSPKTWDSWQDSTSYTSDVEPDPVVVPKVSETQIVYRYRDTSYKWYLKEYTSTYYSTAPSGYPNKDETLISYGSWSTWCTSNPANYDYREEQSETGVCYKATNGTYNKYWTGCNPSGPVQWYSNSGWAFHWPQSAPPAPPSGYTRSVYTYLGEKTVYRYRTLSWKWYSLDYHPDYAVEAPVGFPTKDETQWQISDWTEGLTTEPTSETYRDIESKTQIRYWIALSGTEILAEYQQQGRFELDTGMTVEEVDSSDDYELHSKIMYRYRDELE